MTSSEFKYSIQNNLITNGRKVLVNYNYYAGSIYKIDDIAILITGENLIQLQQATNVSISSPEGIGGSINIPVDNSTSPVRVVDRQVVGDYYLYSIITVDQRVVVADLAASTGSLNVTIQPEIGISAQAVQDYSAVQGTVLVNRESAHIVQSDRLYATSGSKTNPTNLYSIVNNQATPAQVQDSSYSSTGWINGRYKGSSLTSIGNHGADPFLQGNFFEGAFFGKDVDDSYISGIAPSDLDLKEYFFSGKLGSLRYTLEDMKAVKAGSYNTTTTELDFDTTIALGGSLIPKTVNVGELFVINKYIGPDDYQLSTEILQMIAPIGSQQYYPYSDYIAYPSYTNFTMRMKRGYNRTTADSANTNSTLYRIVPTKVYSLAGNFAQSVLQGKIRIKGTTEVVHLDGSGFVVSGSSIDFI